MKNPLLALLMCAAIPATPMTPAKAGDSSGATVLTVTGNLAEPNRAGFDPFSDAFFAFHEREFDKAHAFSRSELDDLPQLEITAHAEAWAQAITAKGPLLADVLAVAGVPDNASISVVALDGYAAEIDAAQRAAKEWIVAIEANDQPLGLGGRGPVWILHDTGNHIVGPDVEGKWVWSVFLIEAAP